MCNSISNVGDDKIVTINSYQMGKVWRGSRVEAGGRGALETAYFPFSIG